MDRDPIPLKFAMMLKCRGDKTGDALRGAIIGGIIGNNITQNVENGGAQEHPSGGMLGHSNSRATGGTERQCSVET